jgi:hypothetical protein
VPIGRLKVIPLYLDGVCTMEDFEVIDIVDNNSPYLAFLGLYWDFNNHNIINLKTRKMIFELGEYRVIVPLDPLEGGRYVEPTIDNILTEYVNQLDKTTAHEEDYINPTRDGMLSWRSINFCSLDCDT